MCQLVAKAVREKDAAVLQDTKRWLSDSETPDVFADPRVLANRLLYTCYIGTENSSRATRKRAKHLAEQIGAYHLDINMDGLVSALQTLFTRITQRKPRFKVEGGTHQENQALQNIQARLRMVLSYLFAQMMPWVQNREGTLLVLGTGNVDEALRGYLTKYDCSSGDINPIGGISKHDLRRFLKWAETHLGYTALAEIVEAPPTAELEPITDTYTQTDEDDMGMTYAELSRFGQLRKMEQCGPVSMFEKLLQEWEHLPPREVAEKVKRFFRYYAINRHKMTTLTPAYHAESYSPDDNRFDLRQFLYNTRWTWQFPAYRYVCQEIGGAGVMHPILQNKRGKLEERDGKLEGRKGFQPSSLPVFRLLIFLFATMFTFTTAHGAPDVPLNFDGWVTEALVKLETNGVTGSFHRHTAPLSRAEVAEIVQQAESRIRSGVVVPSEIDRKLLEKLKREFGSELAGTESGIINFLPQLRATKKKIAPST